MYDVPVSFVFLTANYNEIDYFLAAVPKAPKALFVTFPRQVSFLCLGYQGEATLSLLVAPIIAEKRNILVLNADINHQSRFFFFQQIIISWKSQLSLRSFMFD